ncbi:D-2-hydroxyacid dehydrogenase [Bordetella genomosp. 10]|uniref:D-2-hydroxyacid dehydrogenase n=2 Tax=Bordetella genomosp. 10 TaxID=1416804 RepID=A0A261S209_9BORD|nr:D-2-hydroxyacid dehydrogenase [Bordetella genomosp. 10]
MLIYVENIRGRDPAYLIEPAAVRAAIRGLPMDVDIVDAFSDAPDIGALEKADFFVGAKLDTARLNRHGGRLKLIHCTSAGVEGYLPLDWLPDRAVLTNSSGIHAEKAGEFGLLALLMLNDHVPQHMTSQRSHAWKRKLARPIRGKTVLIYGVGALGGAIAEKAKLLGLNIWGVRRSGAPHPHVECMFHPDLLAQALPSVDFLLVTCPLTAATRGAIGARELMMLPPHAGVVNMARAAVVDYDALAELLREGRLAGAVLDVFDPEPLPATAPWWDVPNLMVIPHVSADDPVGYIDRSLAIFGRNLANLAAGRPLDNVVDASIGY